MKESDHQSLSLGCKWFTFLPCEKSTHPFPRPTKIQWLYCTTQIPGSHHHQFRCRWSRLGGVLPSLKTSATQQTYTQWWTRHQITAVVPLKRSRMQSHSSNWYFWPWQLTPAHIDDFLIRVTPPPPWEFLCKVIGSARWAISFTFWVFLPLPSIRNNPYWRLSTFLACLPPMKGWGSKDLCLLCTVCLFQTKLMQSF